MGGSDSPSSLFHESIKEAKASADQRVSSFWMSKQGDGVRESNSKESNAENGIFSALFLLHWRSPLEKTWTLLFPPVSNRWIWSLPSAYDLFLDVCWCMNQERLTWQSWLDWANQSLPGSPRWCWISKSPLRPKSNQAQLHNYCLIFSFSFFKASKTLPTGLLK